MPRTRVILIALALVSFWQIPAQSDDPCSATCGQGPYAITGESIIDSGKMMGERVINAGYTGGFPSGWDVNWAANHLAPALNAWESGPSGLTGLNLTICQDCYSPDVIIIPVTGTWMHSVDHPNSVAVTTSYASKGQTETGPKIIELRLGPGYGASFWQDEPDPGSGTDLQAILVHEIGHALGLNDAIELYASCTVEAEPARAIKWLDQAAIACYYPPDNPIADVSGLTYAEGRVRWQTIREDGTDHYAIEGCREPNGRGFEVLGTEPSGVGLHDVAVAAGDYPLLRLVEVEEDGGRRVCDIASTRPWSASSAPRLYEPRAVAHPVKPAPLKGSHLRLAGSSMQSSSVVPSLELYTTTATGLAAYQLESYYESIGETVGGLIFSGADPTMNQQIRDDIAAKYSAGTHRFQLVGDWPMPGGSDQWYGDTDNDGVPNVAVTRWPVADEAALAFMVLRMTDYQWVLRFSGPVDRATFLVGDVNLQGNSGAYARWCSEQVESTLPSAVTVSHLFMSSHPDASERNTATVNLLNAQHPDVISILSTISNQDAPGHFFTGNYYGSIANPWNMNALDGVNYVRIVIGASCYSTSYRTDHTATGPIPTSASFVSTYYSKGSTAWVGPTNQSLQDADYIVDRYMFEELWNNPYRPMADSWLAAMQRAYATFAGTVFLPTLDRFEFLGDPVTPLVSPPITTVTAFVEDSVDHVQRNASSVPLVSCPEGDGDKLVVHVDMNAAQVVPYATSANLTLTPPPDRNPVNQFAEGRYVDFLQGTVTAQTLTTINGGTTYRGTFTIPYVGGNGADSALVSFYGVPIGWAHFTVKSYDIKPEGASAGVVDLPDYSIFTTHYNTSLCNCVPIWKLHPYSTWADFAPPDTIIGLPEFSRFSYHYLDQYSPGQNLTAHRNPAALGAISVGFAEEWPVVGQRKLHATVRLDGVEPFKVMMIALKNNDPRFTFVNWQPNQESGWTTVATQVPRDGQQEIMIGVATNGEPDASNVILGSFDINVLSDQPLSLSEDDFGLIFADLLAEDQSQRSIYGSAQSFSKYLSPARFVNQLAQNYPNPFNPQTTLAFSIKDASNVSLAIYDVAGRRVRELVDEHRVPGVYKVVWDGTDARGAKVASGVYFYKLIAGSFVDTKKMVMLK